MNSYLDLAEGEATYRRDQIAEDFRKVGGRHRGAGRNSSGYRWRLHRDQRAGY